MYEVKVKYVKTGEDNPGSVKETYLVNAINCAEAEKKVIDEITPFVFGELDTPQIKKRDFFDIFPKEGGDFFYEAKVEMIVVDGDREARRVIKILQQADTLAQAVSDLKFNLSSYDHELVAIAKSPILDIIE